MSIEQSTDGGTTWTRVTDPTGGESYTLLADPASTTRLLLSDYSALYFSNDSGATWTTKYTAATGSGLGRPHQPSIIP